MRNQELNNKILTNVKKNTAYYSLTKNILIFSTKLVRQKIFSTKLGIKFKCLKKCCGKYQDMLIRMLGIMLARTLGRMLEKMLARMV